VFTDTAARLRITTLAVSSAGATVKVEFLSTRKR